MKTILFYLLIAALYFNFSACKKEEDDHDHDHNHADTTKQNPPANVATYGKVAFNFENFAGNDTLVFNQNLINENGDTLKVNLLNYYVTNVILNKTAGGIHKEKESYHLIEHGNGASKFFTLDSVPVGNYNSITFTIGVDSIRNVSGIQSGALDPAKGMFWSWNSGYIMAKLEGSSPQSSQSSKLIKYHIGGFSGANNVLKTITLTLPNQLDIRNNLISTVKIKADIMEFFKSPNTISIATTHTIHMPGAAAKNMANNYADMFNVISVLN